MEFGAGLGGAHGLANAGDGPFETRQLRVDRNLVAFGVFDDLFAQRREVKNRVQRGHDLIGGLGELLVGGLTPVLLIALVAFVDARLRSVFAGGRIVAEVKLELRAVVLGAFVLRAFFGIDQCGRSRRKDLVGVGLVPLELVVD